MQSTPPHLDKPPPGALPMLSTLATVLLLPYFGWGIYTLRRKYRFHEDLPLLAEAFTLLALVLFYALEVSLLREALDTNRVQFLFASLGLLTSGAALYGPMAISFASRLIVEAVVPGPNDHDKRPRLGPAEALERQKDYEGALQEYYVIARMFPKDYLVPTRIANLHLQLGRPEEAIPWLRRAQKWITTEDQAHTIALRLAEVYEFHLHQSAEARAAIGDFLNAYPNSNDGPMLRARLVTIGAAPQKPDTEQLNALSEAPLSDITPVPAAPKPPRKTTLKKSTPEPPKTDLAALDEIPLDTHHIDRHTLEEKHPHEAPQTPTTQFSLELIETAITEEEIVEEKPTLNLTLEPLNPEENNEQAP